MPQPEYCYTVYIRIYFIHLFYLPYDGRVLDGCWMRKHVHPSPPYVCIYTGPEERYVFHLRDEWRIIVETKGHYFAHRFGLLKLSKVSVLKTTLRMSERFEF